MSGKCAVFDVGGPLTNGDGIEDLALLRTDTSARSRVTKMALMPEVTEQTALQDTAALHKQAAVDRFG